MNKTKTAALTFCSGEEGQSVYIECQIVEQGCHLIELSGREALLGREYLS